jgi:cell division protein FtsB
MAIIEIRDRTRGHEMLVGVVTLLVLFRLWSGGSLDGILRLLLIALRGDEGLTSATAVLIEIVGQLIFGVGVIAIAAWSGLWAIVQDVLVGVRSFMARREESTQDAIIESDYVAALIRMSQNVEALQAQIDAMKAESTWAKARLTGSDE